jgi:hypothetical protein
LANSFKFTNNLPKLTKQLDSNYEHALKKAVYDIHNHLVKKLSGSRSGRTYKVAGTKRTYTASAPNQAPATRTGDLRTSYRPVVEGTGFFAKGIVGSPLDYSVFLEYGTRKMAKRPHLRQSFDETKSEWLKHFVDLI